VATLWGRRWTRAELLARVGRLEQVAGIRLVEGGDGAERGVRMLRCWSGAGFEFEILVDRGFDVAASSPSYTRLTGPQAEFVEECYEHDMAPGPDGLTEAAVINPALGLGVFQRYDGGALPHHITWRQLGTVAYVVAMEPSTNRDAGRFDARARGELTELAPGEERRYRLEIGALDGHQAVQEFTRRVRLLGSRTPA
jgi:Domain of unknown function (DUF4432)